MITMNQTLDNIREQVRQYWRAENYRDANVLLSDSIATFRKRCDWHEWLQCVLLLYHSFMSTDENRAAAKVLRNAIRYRAAFSLYRTLGLHYWRYESKPDVAIRIVYIFLRRHQRARGSKADVIMSHNLLARLYVAIGRKDKATVALKTALRALPPFEPPLAYLFDFDAIFEMYQAGMREDAMAKYIERISEPRFLLSDYGGHFERLSQQVHDGTWTS